VHPAPACNFQQAAALGFVQITFQGDVPFNRVKPHKVGFFAPVLRLFSPVVTEPDVNIL
jgi:hypothetical protein